MNVHAKNTVAEGSPQSQCKFTSRGVALLRIFCHCAGHHLVHSARNLWVEQARLRGFVAHDLVDHHKLVLTVKG